jgi:hypothetical protein
MGPLPMASVVLDGLVGRLAGATAAHVAPSGKGGGLRERDIEAGIVSAAREILPEWLAVAQHKLSVPGWEPVPGRLDLSLTAPAGSRLLFELKVNHVDQALWDLVKLLSLTESTPAGRGYLAVAAPTRTWERTGDCVGLFTPSAGAREWNAGWMFHTWWKAWCDLLDGGRGRPLRVPALVRTALVAQVALPTAPGGYELRVTSVAPVEDAGWLVFDGDWPHGVRPRSR